MASIGNGVVDSPSLSSESGSPLASNVSSSLSSLTDDDKKKARWIWDLLQKAKRWKSYCGGDNWKRWGEFWEGKQWQRMRASGLSMAVINLIYEMVETFIGHFMENTPEQVARARTPQHIPVAQLMTKLLNWVDDINEQQTRGEIPLRSSAVSGIGVRRVDWSLRMDRHRGAPSHSPVDEDCWFASPWCREVEDAEYIIEARNVPAPFVRNNWAEGWRVPLGVWDGSLTPMRSSSGTNSAQNTGLDSSHWGAFTSTDGNYSQITPGTGSNRDDAKDLVTLIEAWIRQDDGTIRLVVCANGVILQDGPSPYDDERYPYAVYNLIRNKNSVYGYSLVGFVEKLQMELNEMHSYALDQQRYESDSPLVVSVANAKEAKQISNLPGAVYIDRDPNKQGYSLITKPGANPRWLEMQEHVIQRIRDLSGNVDILRGQRPAGVTTLGGMEIIRDEANVLVNKMGRHVLAARRVEAILAVDRLRQFFHDERVIRIKGERGEDEYITANERTGKKPDGEWELQNSIPDNFEVDVEFTPAPPGGMQAKMERDLALLQAQVVDPVFVLEDLEFPQETIEAISGRQAEAAKAQAAAENPEAAQADDPESMERQAMEILSGL